MPGKSEHTQESDMTMEERAVAARARSASFRVPASAKGQQQQQQQSDPKHPSQRPQPYNNGRSNMAVGVEVPVEAIIGLPLANTGVLSAVSTHPFLGAPLNGSTRAGAAANTLLSSFRNHEKFYEQVGCGRECGKLGVSVRASHPAVNLRGRTCPELVKELVPYNFVPTYKEEFGIVRDMIACGIPLAMVRWTDGAGHLFRGSVKMKTVLRGRADFKGVGSTSGMLTGQPLAQLQLDVWRSMNVTHPRFFQAMPVPACLEGMYTETATGGTAAVRWLNFFATGGLRLVFKAGGPGQGRVPALLPLHTSHTPPPISLNCF